MLFQISAAEENLLKLFEALIDGRLSSAPSISASVQNKELVIY
jgi:hypothetical protein